jgi:hypothetical protein
MVRYFYACTPLVVVFGTAILFAIPYLALIALMIVALGAAAALVWAIAGVTHMLSRAISRGWHARSDVMRPPPTALQVHRNAHAYAAWRGIDYQARQLVRSADGRDAPTSS